MDKKTALYDAHIEKGGKMVPFAGYIMPVQFQGIVHEVKRVRSTAGVFDVSHMGEINVTGERRKEFVNHITTNNVMDLKPNQVQYSMMLYENGGIVDDLLVYNLKDRILLVVNASNTDKDFEWIMNNKWDDVEIENISSSISQIALQGPKSNDIMKELTDYDLDSIPFYHAAETDVCGINAVLSRTGYTGEDGFEIYMPNEHAMNIYKKMMNAGAEYDIEPIGLGARDTLRLEMRYMLYGNDITKDTTPLEAGLSWAVKMTKDEFIGRDVLIKQKEDGLTKRLCAFEMLERGIPRHDYRIFIDNEDMGFVTSGNASPSLDKYIGLGYVKVPYNKVGNEIYIQIRDKMVKALTVKPPFYKNGSHK